MLVGSCQAPKNLGSSLSRHCQGYTVEKGEAGRAAPGWLASGHLPVSLRQLLCGVVAITCASVEEIQRYSLTGSGTGAHGAPALSGLEVLVPRGHLVSVSEGKAVSIPHT